MEFTVKKEWPLSSSSLLLLLYYYYRILVPPPGVEPGPRQWKCQVLTTGPPGNSLTTPFRLIYFGISITENYTTLKKIMRQFYLSRCARISEISFSVKSTKCKAMRLECSSQKRIYTDMSAYTKNTEENKKLVTKVAHGEESSVTWDQGREFALYTLSNVVPSITYLINKYM